MGYPLLSPHDYEPEITDVDALRAHRKTRLALGYRVFGALKWGALGDGHISARDPERADHFWLARYGAPFHTVTVDDLVLVGPEGTVVEGEGWINQAAHNIHWPIHEARPDIVSAAHTHTPYGTPYPARSTKTTRSSTTRKSTSAQPTAASGSPRRWARQRV
jgi:ribulose-5-phosphate 4-epimerase/fuculose-1-phosphate aldolase